MHNVLTRCSATLQFLYNSDANLLLPVVQVELEASSGSTESTLSVVNYSVSPTGLRSVITTLGGVLEHLDKVSKANPRIPSEEEWNTLVQQTQDTAAEGVDGSQDLKTEQEVQRDLNVVPFGG